jgi:hypothetical protein
MSSSERKVSLITRIRISRRAQWGQRQSRRRGEVLRRRRFADTSVTTSLRALTAESSADALSRVSLVRRLGVVTEL